MITIRNFSFNPFQVNTYLLWDESKECAIVDAGCYDKYEQELITSYIGSKDLKPVRLLNTHSHIDHIAGNAFIAKTYGLRLEAHKAGMPFIGHSKQNGHIYGFENLEVIYPEIFIDEKDIISFGHSKLEVVYTPGHADGSVCFINHVQKFVITGDVLFYQSIGRTDLPTGDYNLLMNSIREKLFTLDKNYTVYSGHGPETSIGFEMISNPFLADLGF